MGAAESRLLSASVLGLMAALVASLAFIMTPAAAAQAILVQPYIQPGDGRTLVGTDVRVIHWLTDQKAGDFSVEYSIAGDPMRTAKTARIPIDFDGVKNTHPQGVIHIVARGGGDNLYKTDLAKARAKLKKDNGANYANYTAKMIAGKHTFVVLDLSPTRLELKALGPNDDELDRIVITKGKAATPE